jgi:hypothetical protein
MVTSIKNLLNDFIKEEKTKAGKQKIIERIIKNTIEKKLQNYIKELSLYKNTLTIYCENSSAVYSLNLQKDRLMEEAKKIFSKVQEIKIKING